MLHVQCLRIFQDISTESLVSHQCHYAWSFLNSHSPSLHRMYSRVHALFLCSNEQFSMRCSHSEIVLYKINVAKVSNDLSIKLLRLVKLCVLLIYSSNFFSINQIFLCIVMANQFHKFQLSRTTKCLVILEQSRSAMLLFQKAKIPTKSCTT